MDVASLSPCGKYRIIEATPGGTHKVLSDLSHVESAERERLGIDKGTSEASIYQAVAERRAWHVIEAKRPYTVLAVFGVGAAVVPMGDNPEATIPGCYVWFLPTQECVTSHGRSLGSPKVCRWVLDWIWASIPTDINKQPVVLFNGVSVENGVVARWLKKAVGAKVAAETFPAGPKQVPAHVFFLHQERAYV